MKPLFSVVFTVFVYILFFSFVNAQEIRTENSGLLVRTITLEFSESSPECNYGGVLASAEVLEKPDVRVAAQEYLEREYCIPIAGVGVAIYDSNENILASSVSDEKGKVTFIADGFPKEILIGFKKEGYYTRNYLVPSFSNSDLPGNSYRHFKLLKRTDSNAMGSMLFRLFEGKTERPFSIEHPNNIIISIYDEFGNGIDSTVVKEDDETSVVFDKLPIGIYYYTIGFPSAVNKLIGTTDEVGGVYPEVKGSKKYYVVRIGEDSNIKSSVYIEKETNAKAWLAWLKKFFRLS